MFYKVVVTVWVIKHRKGWEGVGGAFSSFKTFNTGGGGEAGGETHIKLNLLSQLGARLSVLHTIFVKKKNWEKLQEKANNTVNTVLPIFWAKS